MASRGRRSRGHRAASPWGRPTFSIGPRAWSALDGRERMISSPPELPRAVLDGSARDRRRGSSRSSSPSTTTDGEPRHRRHGAVLQYALRRLVEDRASSAIITTLPCPTGACRTRSRGRPMLPGPTSRLLTEAGPLFVDDIRLPDRRHGGRGLRGRPFGCIHLMVAGEPALRVRAGVRPPLRVRGRGGSSGLLRLASRLLACGVRRSTSVGACPASCGRYWRSCPLIAYPFRRFAPAGPHSPGLYFEEGLALAVARAAPRRRGTRSVVRFSHSIAGSVVDAAYRPRSRDATSPRASPAAARGRPGCPRSVSPRSRYEEADGGRRSDVGKSAGSGREPPWRPLTSRRSSSPILAGVRPEARRGRGNAGDAPGDPGVCRIGEAGRALALAGTRSRSARLLQRWYLLSGGPRPPIQGGR